RVLHMRPDAALEGPYVAAIGSTLWLVQQRARLTQLLGGAAGGWGAQPLTPLMRETLAAPHLVSAYKILGSDGAWLDYLVWGAGRLQAAVLERGGGLPEDSDLRPWVARLPQLVAAVSYVHLTTYDMALTADITSNLVTLKLTHSEI
ncbi:MAG TPA: hypothetical protein VFH51_20375, partial [Myxococcota bacterium]|nr:hypothetical protein [Myxococcota bacterium]